MNFNNKLRKLVEPDEFERLEQYVSLLAKWRNVTNLISEKGFADIWDRHILDAIFLYHQRSIAKTWVDIGSGAGIPSVVLAILLVDIPGARVHCIEIDRRKCSFLREVAAALSVPMKIHNVLAESLDPSDFLDVEVVTSRAFSSIKRILAIANPFLAKGAVAILPRGRKTHHDIAAASNDRYTINVTPNLSSPDGIFVRIEMRVAHLQ